MWPEARHSSTIVRLTELILDDSGATLIAADAGRGQQLYHKHPAALRALPMPSTANGSAVGPALDKIASRSSAAAIRESLLEPSKVMAKGYEHYLVSPMPPMADIFSPQELSDIEAYLQTLK